MNAFEDSTLLSMAMSGREVVIPDWESLPPCIDCAYAWDTDEEDTPDYYRDIRPISPKDAKRYAEEGEITRIWLGSKLLAFGDYDNSCAVERANVRDFLDMFGARDGIAHIFGDYGSEAVYIRADVYFTSEDIRDVFHALEDYPLISNETCSEIEVEMETDAWQSWIRHDFVQALEHQIEQPDESWLDGVPPVYVEVYGSRRTIGVHVGRIANDSRHSG